MSRLKIPRTIVKLITTKSENENEESGITMPYTSFEDLEDVLKKIKT